VQLWHAELLSGVLEVDSALKVLRADNVTGNMLGCKGSMLQRKMLNRWDRYMYPCETGHGMGCVGCAEAT
jgi:hypothetical protein